MDAFDYSDHRLCSALGKYDGNVYKQLYEWAQRDPVNKQTVSDTIFPFYPQTAQPLLLRLLIIINEIIIYLYARVFFIWVSCGRARARAVRIMLGFLCIEMYYVGLPVHVRNNVVVNGWAACVLPYRGLDSSSDLYISL